MHEDISVKLLPYLAKSNNLMESFAIIGYKEEILIENLPNLLDKEENLELSIISIITSNSPFKYINYDDIIKRIYPQKPSIIKIIKNERKPNICSVISSSCFNSLNKEGKIFYNCYALRFYEKFKDYISNVEYYVPKAFLIISEYPFFTTFYKICINIYKINIEEKEIGKDNYYRKTKIKTEYYILDNIPIEIFIQCFVNYIPSPINKKIILSIFANEDRILIPNLSGYPYIDFDLCKVLNMMSINKFLEIYLLVFLEESLLFFSPDLEKLNLLMYSLYILNYPLIDSSYFNNLKSVSKNEMDNVIGMNSFAGINSEFDCININDIEGVNFVIDLENKEIIMNDNIELIETKKLLNYVRFILKNKNINSIFLLNLLSNLKKKLEKINILYNKIVDINSKSFFNMNNIISDINLSIQEAFYDFFINILIIFNGDFQIDNSCSSIVKNIPKNNLPPEESNFLIYFRKTDKYNIYFNNFICNFKPFEEFKLSSLFSNEFTYIKRYYLENKIPNRIDYFRIINSVFPINQKPVEIIYNNLFKDFRNIDNKRIILKNARTKNNQLFYLDKKLVNAFLYYIKNKNGFFELLKHWEKMEITFDLVKKKTLYLKIQNKCNEFLNSNYFIRGSVVYIFSIAFPFFCGDTIFHFLPEICQNINKIELFKRNYIYILLKSINKYFLLNQEKYQYCELNYQNVKKYCETVKSFIIEKNILPNEEIFLLLKKIINEYNKYNINNEEREIKDKEYEQNEKNIFIFKYYKVESYVNTIKFDVVEKERSLLHFKFKGKAIEYNFLSYEKVFQQVYSIYEDYFFRLNFSVVDLEIKPIIELIVNLIYYLLLPEFNEKNLALLLYKTIIVLKQLENDLNEYKKNKTKI